MSRLRGQAIMAYWWNDAAGDTHSAVPPMRVKGTEAVGGFLAGCFVLLECAIAARFGDISAFFSPTCIP